MLSVEEMDSEIVFMIFLSARELPVVKQKQEEKRRWSCNVQKTTRRADTREPR
jgi:hypothetical protein